MNEQGTQPTKVKPRSFKRWLTAQRKRKDAVGALAYIETGWKGNEFPDLPLGVGARAILRGCRDYLFTSYSYADQYSIRCELLDGLTQAVREYFAVYPYAPAPSETEQVSRQIRDLYCHTGLRVSPCQGSVKNKETYSL